MNPAMSRWRATREDASFDSRGEQFLIQLELTAHEPGLDADLRGSLLGSSVERVSDARADLEQTILLAVVEEVGEASVQIWYSEGSVLVWVLVTLGGGVLQGAAWDLVRAVESRLRHAVMRWFNRHFGQTGGKTVGTTAYVLAPAGRATQASPQSRSLSPELIVWAMALLAQLTLVFVVIWLTTH
jgi:hypothetical protein